MKIKVSEAKGLVLDYLVGKLWIENHIEEFDYFFMKNHDSGFDHYSTNWKNGGPIIEQEKIDTRWTGENWIAGKLIKWVTGPTLLIAAMRCYVASELGEEVEVPEELLK